MLCFGQVRRSAMIHPPRVMRRNMVVMEHTPPAFDPAACPTDKHPPPTRTRMPSHRAACRRLRTERERCRSAVGHPSYRTLRARALGFRDVPPCQQRSPSSRSPRNKLRMLARVRLQLSQPHARVAYSNSTSVFPAATAPGTMDGSIGVWQQTGRKTRDAYGT